VEFTGRHTRTSYCREKENKEHCSSLRRSAERGFQENGIRENCEPEKRIGARSEIRTVWKMMKQRVIYNRFNLVIIRGANYYYYYY
jgi:hypothetical protein